MAHLVHICPRYLPAHGGVEAYVARLSESLAAEGHRVTVRTTDAATVRGFTSPDEPRVSPARETINGVHIERLPVKHVPAQRYVRTLAHALPFGARWKANTLRWTPWVPGLASVDGRPALVHAAGLPYTSLLWAGAELAKRAQCRFVVSPFTHVPPPGSRGARMRAAYLSRRNLDLMRRADRVLVQTERERATLAGAGIEPQALRLIGLGVDPAECAGGSRQRARRRWSVSDDEIVVGHLGNKSWDKGTNDLLDAAETLWSRGERFRLVLAGPEMPSFAVRWRTARFPAYVVNLGVLSSDELRDFYAGLDAFALPSYVESFGLSLLEAGLNGSALVAYDHGGPGEILEEGTTARLVPPGDIAALADALAAVIGRGDERSRLGRAAQDLARAHTWARSLDRSRRVYEELLGPAA
jgi:glycosyltransferase involved in cell wall biosynthesis